MFQFFTKVVHQHQYWYAYHSLRNHALYPWRWRHYVPSICQEPINCWYGIKKFLSHTVVKNLIPQKFTYIIKILSNCQFLKKDFSTFSQSVKSVTVELWNSLHDLLTSVSKTCTSALTIMLHYHQCTNTMQVSYSLLSYVFKDIYKFHVMFLNTKFLLVMVPYSFLFWKF
jgi:hypothetical protein